MMALALLAFASCSDEDSVDLSNRKFVRIDQSAISMVIGEKIKVTATADTIAGDSYKLSWSVLDSSIANAENTDNNVGVITAVAAGKTILKVETTDGKLMYFADLTVTEGKRAIKLLTIGSGISNDATNYLYDMAKSAGTTMIIGNMFVEGASLEDHAKNLSENRAVYQYRRVAADGSSTILNNLLLKNIIKGDNWDFIAFEESLPLAGKPDGYQTYLPQLMEEANELASNPGLKFVLHQPWAYAKNSQEAGFANYDKDQTKMFNAIVDAISKAKESAKIELVVPTGTAIQNSRTTLLGEAVLNDGAYLNMNIRQYTAACTWFETLFGGNAAEISYKPDNFIYFHAQLAKEAAHHAVTTPKAVTSLTNFGINNFNPVYVDFGPVESGAPFNNYRFPTDPMLESLRNDKGIETSLQIVVDRGFTGVLERGLDNSLGLPRSASEDMFFSDGKDVPVSGFKVSNLTKGQKYSFVFYGHINDRNTETEFRIIGGNEGVAYLVNDDNWNRTAVVTGIEPASDGSIAINLGPGPRNTQWAKFFGVNAMMIVAEANEQPLP